MNFKSFKFWLNIITIAALVLLVIFARGQVIEAFKTFARLNLLWIALILPVQALNYFSVGKFYQSYLKTLDEKVKTREMFKVALEMNFVNNVFPSGGVSGFGYLGVRLNKLGVKGSKTTLVQTSRHVLTFLSFIIYLLIALFLLSLFGNASRFIILIASSLSSIIIFGSLILVYVISDETRIKQFTGFLPKILNRIFKLFRKKNKNTIDIAKVEELFGDLHDDYTHVRKNWKDLRYPFLWTMLMNFTEILTIFIVYLAFGTIVNPGAIIIAYAVANVAGLVAILPGGVGIYEGLMTGVMTSAGVRQGLALSATLVYRVLNMLISLPIGYYFYQKALKEDAIDPEAIEGIGDEDED